MSWKCSVPAQLSCKGMGKKAWLRLLQVWAIANCRPGLRFLPNSYWQYTRRALLLKKLIMCQPFTVKIKEKQQQHLQPPMSQPYNVCCSFLFLWIGGAKLNWRSVGWKWSAWAVLEDHTWCEEWFKQSLCCAIAWWCQWAGYYYTVCSSEDHSPAAARFEWTKAGPWERIEEVVKILISIHIQPTFKCHCAVDLLRLFNAIYVPTACKIHCHSYSSNRESLIKFHFYLFQLKVACENSSLAGVYTLAAIEELWHEGRVKGIKVDRGHVVNSKSDFLLEKVVAFVEKDLQQHVDEVEEHRGPKQLLKRQTHTHTKRVCEVKVCKVNLKDSL